MSISKENLEQVAIQNENIIRRGKYEKYDSTVDISEDLINCFLETKTISSPNDFYKGFKQLEKELVRNEKTNVYVCSEGTVVGAYRLKADTSSPVLVLNFASAKHPGGGYLRGSKAQEEDICRCSALYYSIKNQSEFYSKYEKTKPFYSDLFIYSPDVPFFRDENYDLLEDPFCASIITYAAPNNCNSDIPKHILYNIFEKRIRNILSYAYFMGYKHLVLGAWGCGVFNNDPNMVAKIFAKLIKEEFNNVFINIKFSILDNTEDKKVLKAFEERLNE